MLWLKENKSKVLVAILLYFLVCLMGIGGFITALKKADEINSTLSLWGKYAMDPITVIKTITSDQATQSSFISLCGLMFLCFAYLSIKYVVKTAKTHDFQGEEHGSSNWSKNGEEYRKLSDGSEILNKKSGFILSKNHFLGLDSRKVRINKNILVFGGSGTGKTACFIKPNILQKLGSYVITDPKGELYRETSKYLAASGYDVKVLNLVDPEFSNRYNPLAHIRDYADVDIIAHTIVEGGSSDGQGKAQDPFWDNTAKILLKACIYYVISVLPPEERNLSSCLNIVRAGGSDESVFDKLFVGELKPEHPGRKEYEGIRVGADKTKQSIAIALVSKLSHFDSPNMMKLTTGNDIDFEVLGEKKTAIYVVSPDSHTTYNYILTIFYGQLLQRLYAAADKNGGALKQPVYVLLDEFANIGKIPDFNQKLSTSRSRMISMSIIVQSLDQLVDLYKDLHENIISNCDTQIFLGSQSIKTCEYFSKSLGQKTITFQNKSKNRDKHNIENQSFQYTSQRQGRELMTIDELKRLPMDDEIILVRGLKPIQAKKAWYFLYHPERETIKKYMIKDFSEMVKMNNPEVRTVDVEKRIKERMEAARQVIREENENSQQPSEGLQESKEKSVGENVAFENKEVNSENPSSLKQNEDLEKKEVMDLQKELEKKFDELFGTEDSTE